MTRVSKSKAAGQGCGGLDVARDVAGRETIENVEVIIDEWIETAKELGRPIPKPKGGRLIFA